MRDFAKQRSRFKKDAIWTSCRSEVRLMSNDRTNFRYLGGRHLGVARIQTLAEFSLKRAEDDFGAETNSASLLTKWLRASC